MSDIIASAEITVTDVKDGVGIDSVVTRFLATHLDKGVTMSTGDWSVDPPSIDVVNKYLWSYESITYTDGYKQDGKPAIIGVYGEDGVGIKNIFEYYLVSDKSAGILSTDSRFKLKIPTMDETNRYLWKYEEILYTNNERTSTSPVVVGVYGEKGTSIKSIKNYYLATSASGGVSRDTDGFDETMKPLSLTNKYLWNYETIEYENPTSFHSTEPVIIGVHGDDGKDGTDAKLLYLSSTLETMSFNADGNASPASQTATIEAKLQNTSGSISFSAKAYNGTSALSDNVALIGSGNSRTFSVSSFPSNATHVSITATLGSLTDTISIFKLRHGKEGVGGTPGQNAIVGYLTNESITLGANSSGRVGSFTPATGTFRMFDGTTEVTTSASYTLENSSGLVANINSSTGVYSITAMSANTATAEFKATYDGVSIFKTVTLSKSIAGEKGEKGDPGLRGLQGLEGPEGKQGIKGDDGADGKSSYTHIAYATGDQGQSFNHETFPQATYIGMYVSDKQNSSENWEDYEWTLIKGSRGEQGLPGPEGIGGITPYLHTAWANNSTGTSGFSTTDSTNKLYIGTYTSYARTGKGRNLVVRTNELDGMWINPAGEITSGRGTAVMNNYIDVSPNQTLTFTKTGSSTSSYGEFWRWRWLDENEDYISRRANSSNEFQWVVPSNAHYIQVSYPMDSYPQVEKGTEATEYSIAPEDAMKDSNNPADYSWTKIKGDKGDAGDSAISAVLTNESITLAADKDGVVHNHSYVGNTGTFLLMEGTVNKSAETKFEVVDQTSVFATINTSGSYTISDMTNGTSVTTGQATFRATYKRTTIDKTVTISKSIAGQTGGKGDPGAPGGKGDPGTPATSYWLTSSVDTITVKYNGDYDPKTITYYGHSKTGSNNTQNYAGRFIIQTSIDGINFAQAYISPVDMDEVDFHVPEDVLFIKAKFYQAGGTTYLLDEQTTPILHSADGLRGIGLEDKDYQVGTEVFTDKADDSVVHVEIDGKSYQHAGSGKNLFSVKDYVELEKDLFASNTYSLTSDNKLQVNITDSRGVRIDLYSYILNIKENTDYTFSADTEMNWRINIYDADGNLVLNSANIKGKKATFNSGSGGVQLTTKFFPVESNHPIVVGDIQLEEGTSVTEYELPAPTPDYPIEIHSLNDFDVVSQKSEGGTIDGIEVGGRNYVLGSSLNGGLWGVSTMTTNPEIAEFINSPWNPKNRAFHAKVVNGRAFLSSSQNNSLTPLEKGDNVTFSLRATSADPRFWAEFLDEDFNRVQGLSNSSLEKIGNEKYARTFEAPSNAKYFSVSRIGLGVVDRVQNQEVIFGSFKLERGTKATDWTPSPEDTSESDNYPLIDKINLLLSEPLRSVGDVKDRLFKDNNDGLWKIERNLKEIQLGKDFLLTSTASSKNPHFNGEIESYYRTFSDMKVGGALSSTHFDADGSRTYQDIEAGHGTVNKHTGSALFVLFNVFGSIHPNLSSFNSWIESQELSGKQVKLIYELDTPGIEVLDGDLQDKLNNLRSFQDSNYVYTLLRNEEGGYY